LAADCILAPVRYTLAIFDFDGTIVDTRRPITMAVACTTKSGSGP